MPHGRPRRRCKTKPILSEKFARSRLPVSYNSWLHFVIDHTSVPSYTSKKADAVYLIENPNQTAISKLAQEDLQELLQVGVINPLRDMTPTKGELSLIWHVIKENNSVWLLSPKQERMYFLLKQLYKFGLFLSPDLTVAPIKKFPELFTIPKEEHADTTSGHAD